VGIISTGSYLPPRVVTNFDLEQLVDTSDEWIQARTGIIERRIAEPGVATSDLAVPAAEAALARAGLSGRDIDLVIVATVTPDMMFPVTACLVQERIGAKRAGAFDLLVGCTGFVYGLALAAQAVGTGAFERVLLIGAETLSRITDWNDRSTCVLFGDGAGATVVAPVEEGRGLLSFVVGNDGSGADKLKIPAGGSRLPASEETVRGRQHYLQMEGNEIFRFAVRIMEEASLEALKRAGLEQSEVDLVIPHQANARIIDAAAKRLKIPPERFLRTIFKYGNNSAASIPIALDEAVEEGLIKRGDHLLLTSFGAGLSWGAAVLRW
jgi:3-oxoacyl-[acyl-carrier-protein] synthase-3